jgi:gluconate 2-dehydrogenase gamma chain
MTKLRSDQVALLEAFVARLIPTDEHGPGAREANVVRYILQALAADYREDVPTYVEGLATVEERSLSMHGRHFVDLTTEQQDTLLRSVEAEPAGDEWGLGGGAFFDLILQHTREGMFCDPSWGGNAGFVGWALLNYAGPRDAWTSEQQEIDAVVPAIYSDLYIDPRAQ